MVRVNPRISFDYLIMRSSNPATSQDSGKPILRDIINGFALTDSRAGVTVPSCFDGASSGTVHLVATATCWGHVNSRSHSGIIDKTRFRGIMRTFKIAVAVIFAVLFSGVFAGQAHAGENLGAAFDDNSDRHFPLCDAVMDVTKPPYSAKGDGKTDDTAAIQRALNDLMGQHRILYFPNGNYLVSKTLVWSKKNSNGREAWGFNWIQGQNASKTIIRLADQTCIDPKSPASIMCCGGYGSADWFHNYIQDITFDAGSGNPGAVGLQFYSNNTGAIRDLLIISRDGQGVTGLDLAYRDMNGPLFVGNVEVRGFEVGIRTGNAVNSQTFEHITLSGQSKTGFENSGQAIALRGFRSENSVPAVCTYGTFSLLDAQLIGKGGAERLPAVVNFNGGRILLRDIHTTGYARAIADVSKNRTSPPPFV